MNFHYFRSIPSYRRFFFFFFLSIFCQHASWYFSTKPIWNALKRCVTSNSINFDDSMLECACHSIKLSSFYIDFTSQGLHLFSRFINYDINALIHQHLIFLLNNKIHQSTTARFWSRNNRTFSNHTSFLVESGFRLTNRKQFSSQNKNLMKLNQSKLLICIFEYILRDFYWTMNFRWLISVEKQPDRYSPITYWWTLLYECKRNQSCASKFLIKIITYDHRYLNFDDVAIKLYEERCYKKTKIEPIFTYCSTLLTEFRNSHV